MWLFDVNVPRKLVEVLGAGPDAIPVTRPDRGNQGT
jgi:hypothetical protein